MYDESGQIVKYSLLGSQEIFEKQKKIQRSMNKDSAEYMLFSTLSRGLFKNKVENTAIMALKKQNMEKKALAKKGEFYVTKSEVLNELEDIEKRIRQNM